MLPTESDAVETELGDLDAALDRARRRLYAVENGLVQVPDPVGEATTLREQCAALGERFRAAYRRWQQAARDEA